MVRKNEEYRLRRIREALAATKVPRIDRFMSRVKKSMTGCWFWSGSFLSQGYGQFYWGVIDGKEKNIKASRASYLLFKGEIADRLMVCHTCDNRACVNPDHLYLGTHLDNMRDRNERGRTPKGEEHYLFVRSDGITDRVRDLVACGVPIAEIPGWVGIGRTTMYRCRGMAS